MIDEKKTKSDYAVVITEPPVGDVPLVNGRIRVQIHVKGKSKVLEVRAQAYKGQAPAIPEFKLAPGNLPHVYEGKIPAFMGRFRILAAVRFERDSAEMEFDDQGPYMGVQSSTNQVDIMDPFPGNVSLDMGAGFEVRVFARGNTGVVSVDAEAYNGVAPVTPMGPLAQVPGTDVFAGTITGLSGNFRIKAMATFGAGNTGVDDDGNYTGIPFEDEI